MISRRHILRQLVTGMAASAVIPPLAGASTAVRGPAVLSGAANNAVATVRLNRNENAYGPSKKVIAAMWGAMFDANRYPELETEMLQVKLAVLHGVAPEQIVLGCGAGDIVRMAVNAFVGSDKTLVTGMPTFDLVPELARCAGAKVVGVALNKNYAHDLQAMSASTDTATGLVYICNPNNPTGSLTPRQDIDRFIKSLPPHTYVLIDEAYHHYVSRSADYASFIDRRLDDERVIVVRTFSKMYGLAGLRVGYAVTAPETAYRLNSSRLSEPVNVVAAKAAVAALEDVDHVRECVQKNADDRHEFLDQANARRVRAIDSHANFVMLNTGSSVLNVIEHFRENSVALPQPFPLFDNCIRVSLGTKGEMCEFWRVWDLMSSTA
jgi:histidinol-phosphate aminotransferase